MSSLLLITLNPGHFHAALVQKEMYADVSPRVHVYAPLGPDLLAHVQRIAAFNGRSDRPTHWQLEIHTSDDFLERMARERPGDIVVIAGRNARKLDWIEAAIAADLHVLADKPWILTPEQRPQLGRVLDDAERRGRIAYDVMTERYEITSILQRELVQDRAIIGELASGSVEEPSVIMESAHFLKKMVAGAPLRRPPWFFDVHEQGEALSDVGTHLVDLVFGAICSEEGVALSEVVLHQAKRWPTTVSRADFCQITGEVDFPGDLNAIRSGETLPYFCNTQLSYAVRGIHIRLEVRWGLEAEPGAGDTHFAMFQGARSRIEIRQGPAESFRPELYVIPRDASEATDLEAALIARTISWQHHYPGVSLQRAAGGWRIVIPDGYRIGHEAHFAQVTRQFLRYVRGEAEIPAWEKPAMLAKYFVTTEGVALARALHSH